MNVSPELFRDILFSLSGLSFGAATAALGAYVYKFFKNDERVNAVGHVLVKISWLLVVGVIFATVLIKLTAVPPTWQGWVYASGLVLGTIGFFIVAWSEGKAIRAKVRDDN